MTPLIENWREIDKSEATLGAWFLIIIQLLKLLMGAMDAALWLHVYAYIKPPC